MEASVHNSILQMIFLTYQMLSWGVGVKESHAGKGGDAQTVQVWLSHHQKLIVQTDWVVGSAHRSIKIRDFPIAFQPPPRCVFLILARCIWGWPTKYKNAFPLQKGLRATEVKKKDAFASEKTISQGTGKTPLCSKVRQFSPAASSAVIPSGTKGLFQ